MRLVGFLSRQVRPARAISSFALVLLIATSFGCGSSSTPGNESQSGSASTSTDLPELSNEVIHERINYTRVWDVPDENGTAPPIVWNFDEDEPKEITVVEKQVDTKRATIVLDIKTSTSPRSRNPRQLAGQIRTEWELKTGWVLRRWEIVETENISMKYKNLSPPAANSNSPAANSNSAAVNSIPPPVNSNR